MFSSHQPIHSLSDLGVGRSQQGSAELTMKRAIAKQSQNSLIPIIR
ncbi:hypothetical protein [Kamptonema sp. PCC 6506]|nr:hypothetical protein [Kamptonema sp. PCC 6506]